MARRQLHLTLLLTTATLFGKDAALAQTTPSPYTSAARYDMMGRQTGSILPDPDGAQGLLFAAVRNSYDGRGRLIKVESGQLASWQPETTQPANWGAAFTVLSSVETTYDAMGRKARQVVKGSDGVAVSVTQFSYNAAGHLECTAMRMNPAIYGSLPASACTQGTAGGHGPDRITRSTYDAAGQLMQVREGVGTTAEAVTVTYTYTANGKTEYVIDANGNRAKREYDGHDRQSRWIFPSLTTPTAYNPATPATALSTSGAVNLSDFEQYGYDGNGNRTSLRKRDGATLTYEYDALNRLTRKIVPERAGLDSTHTRDVYYRYDLRDLQVSARFDSASGPGLVMAYDGLGRMTSAANGLVATNPVLAFGYDKNGNRTSSTHPGSITWTLQYDGLNRLKAVVYGGTTLLTAAYNTRGLLSGVDRNGGSLDQTLAYDNAGRLSQLGFATGTNSNNVNWTFARSPSSQVVTETRTNDAYAWTGSVNLNRNYAVNGLNQYTTAGSASFCYDANGNLTADGASVYLYDIENRLIEKRAQGSGNTNCAALSYAGALQAQLHYDPLGRLYRAQGSSGAATRFIHDGNALVMEMNDAGTAVLNRYVHGSNAAADDPLIWHPGATVSAVTARHLYVDSRGSIVLAADSGGAMAARNTFDEYGIPGPGNGGRFQYTGQVWLSELGAYYYKARIYSPTLGRFLQVDPIGYADQINLYAYVANDPVNGIDPSGERDIYIGGGGDTVTEIVKSYAMQQMKLHPERDIRYYIWDDVEAITTAVLSTPEDEPLNVIGHSLGGAEAMRQNGVNYKSVDTLVTIDPVDFPGDSISAPTANNIDAKNWTNVTANPESWDRSDYVAAIGGKVSSDRTAGADTQVSSEAHHGQFGRMMRESGAQDAVDQTYCTPTRDDPC